MKFLKPKRNYNGDYIGTAKVGSVRNFADIVISSRSPDADRGVVWKAGSKRSAAWLDPLIASKPHHYTEHLAFYANLEGKQPSNPQGEQTPQVAT